MGRILAVDDDLYSRTVLDGALRARGHTSTCVASSAEALARLQGEPFDAVVTEASTAGVDGVAVARAAAGRQVPCMFLCTRRIDFGGVPHAAVLLKPLEPATFGRALDLTLARQRTIGGHGWSGAAFLANVAGSVANFPIARVLFLAHRIGATGLVRIERADGVASIGLRGGKVVYVIGVEGLLSALDARVADTLDLARDVARAVAFGHSPDVALRAAAEGLGAWVVARDEAAEDTVSWQAAWTPPAGAFPLPDPVPRLVARGLARARPDARVMRAWSELSDHMIQLRLPDDASDTTWGLDAVATRVLRLAGSARTVARLLTLAEPPREGEGSGLGVRRLEVLRALDLLRALGLLALTSAPSDRAGASDARVAAGPSEDPQARRLALALANLERAAPVDVLDLGARATLTEEDVSNAFRKVSLLYHPDLYFGAAPEVRRLAEACFARVNAAQQALLAPGAIAQARMLLEARARGEKPVSESEAGSARMAFKRAEHRFRARDYAGAAPLFEEALRAAPNVWPHALYAAWCGYLAKTLRPADALARLEALKPTEPAQAAEVLYHAGAILKQEGRQADALTFFRSAMQKDPLHREAQREVRLHELRNPTVAIPFAGLFKKKA